jgi:hypothetical protein
MIVHRFLTDCLTERWRVCIEMEAYVSLMCAAGVLLHHREDEEVHDGTPELIDLFVSSFIAMACPLPIDISELFVA